SGRINLNQILQFELSDEETRNMLLFLPNMTEETADAILDFIDENDTVREFGVESDYYMDLDPGFLPPNGPLESIDELLRVAGVTRELLYGEDTNRNGLLDPNEDDGDATAPFDDGDGVLNPGWAAYLTLDSKEVNKRLDGSERVNINDGVLTDLYDMLVEEFDEDVARFVVAFRLNGPYEPLEETEDSDLIAAIDEATGAADGTLTDAEAEQANANAINRATQGFVADVAEGIANGIAGSGGSVTRDGMDLSKGAQHDVTSIYEMIGAQVEIEMAGSLVLLGSHWGMNSGDMEGYLPDILDRLTVVDENTILGRLNVNQARLGALLGIPNMPEDVAIAIANSPMGDDTTPIRGTAGWLLTNGLVDIPQMVKLDRFVTGRGLVYRAQVVGFFGEGGGYTRLEATMDASEYPAKILSVTDLTSLGRGYTNEMLMGVTESPR
nr:general secretion pathway protein GspK [Planctomycetota bacterium]